jgi:zinc and cadmium transporter
VQVYAAAIGFSVLGSVGGLATASTFLLLGDGLRIKLVPWLISYAVGTLLGVSLLALLPEALATLPPPQALGTLLGGVLVFFLLEKLVLWRHCHTGHECEVHTSSAASLVIVGDAFHTFVDGALIAAAVLTSIPLGATTAVAVAAHEIPQEVGDVAILLAAGYSRRRALILNVISGAAGIGGALFAYAAVGVLPGIRPYVLAVSSASFLYIAMSDLIPDLHRGQMDRNAWRQVLLIGLGIATVLVFENLTS